MKYLNDFFKVGVLASCFSANAATPYIDAIVSEIRELAPISEGYLWTKVEGNELPVDRWLFQTPDCWGDANPDTCTGANSIASLADEIEEIIASAQNWVDVTTDLLQPDWTLH